MRCNAFFLCLLLGGVFAGCGADSKGIRTVSKGAGGNTGMGLDAGALSQASDPVPPSNSGPIGEPSETTAKLPVLCGERCEPVEPSDRPKAGPRPVCPDVAPKEGSSCELSEGGTCGYGDDLGVGCRTVFECRSKRWSVPDYLRGVACRRHEEDYCPRNPSNGSACVVGEAGQDVPCSYDGAIDCICGALTGSPAGTRGVWVCYGPPADSRCPARVPNVGEGCDVQALECVYYVDPCGMTRMLSVFCFQGAWQEGEPLTCISN